MAEKLELNEQGLRDRSVWEEKGYKLPQYDRKAVCQATREHPDWIHFGGGNIFKAFQANAAQRLLNEGVMDKGIIAVERSKRGEDPYDGYAVLVTLKVSGEVEKTVVGSIAETCYLYGSEERLKEIFREPGLQMASFTITEKGYSLVDGSGEYLPEVKEDLEKGPHDTKHYMARMAELLLARYEAGQQPIAMVSMDNCSHNGDKLRSSVCTFVDAWAEAGLVPEGFVDYVENGEKVSFPWSMIDKITPSPDLAVGEMLEQDGLEGFKPVVTSRGSHKAPFVNAEESEYLVIEDDFPNGRPPLEKAGIYFTDRDTVNKVERMKVCTCLNPLHTALAVFGCLLGYERISDEMKDPELKELVNVIGYKEGLPVVTDPGILDPKEFIDTVVNVRIPNPFMPDTPQRIATDTSQKLPIRFGETIKAYEASETLNVKDLKKIPLVFAGWLRYLMAVNDEGEAFEPSPDPLLDTVSPFVAKYTLGDKVSAEQAGKDLSELLKNESIFGVDLTECGLAGLVCQYFTEMLQGKGAVRNVLKKYVTEA